jgi:hypothetical protein
MTVENLQVSAEAAQPLTTAGISTPARLTATSPSVIATARWERCASASSAHIRIRAVVAKPLTSTAAMSVAGRTAP